MIGRSDNENLYFMYEFTEDCIDILGDNRMQLIDECIQHAVRQNVQQSYQVALTGALRRYPNFRPEVLIDASGEML